MKYIRVLIHGILYSALVFSFNSQADTKDYNGLYLGVQGGLTDAYSRFSNSNLLIDKSAFSLNQLFDLSFDNAQLGGAGGLHLGYGRSFNWFYLGTELHATFEKIKINSNPVDVNFISTLLGGPDFFNTQTSITITDDYGLSINPGLIVAPDVLLMGKIGIDKSGIQLTQSQAVLTALGGGTSGFSSGSQSRSISSTALQLGIGLKTFITPYLTWNFEYLYTDYGSYQASLTSQKPGANQFSSSYQYQIKTQGLFAGLSYFFDHPKAPPKISDSTPPFDGIYFGLQVGPMQGEYVTRANILEILPGVVTAPITISASNYQNTFGGGASLGVGVHAHHLYLGIEGQGILNHIKSSSNFDSIGKTTKVIITNSVNVSLEDEYGINLRSGFIIPSNVLFYGRVGYARSQLRAQILTVINTNTAGQPIKTGMDRGSKKAAGVRWGVGMEAAITPRLHLSLEGTCEKYNSITLNTITDFIVIAGGKFNNESINIRPIVKSFLLGLSYYFTT